MQTSLSAEFKHPQYAPVEEILRKCVHCGLCNATCPTYQLLGDELDGPRGRIYQLKQLFEGVPANAAMRLHLDRCLTCRACETACPSGVEYAQLLEIGRDVLERKLPRAYPQRLVRRVLRAVLTRPGVFGTLLGLARRAQVLLPAALRNKLPPLPSPIPPSNPSPLAAPHPIDTARRGPAARHRRKMLLLAGCVQPHLTPDTNLAAARLLDRFGVSLVEAAAAGCCGAVALHTSGQESAYRQAKALIDVWLPYLDTGFEAIITSASGCGLCVKEYARLLSHDPQYADKARRVSQHTRDLIEVVENVVPPDYRVLKPRKVAFQSPCTLQHGQQIKQRVETLLQRIGYEVCAVADAHLCCGSAGTYSVLQPHLANQLRHNKLRALSQPQPQLICTANVGCQVHLGATSTIRVVHWIELV